MMDASTLLIWCIGVVAMAASAWIQDRRDRRREEGQLQALKDALAKDVADLYVKVDRLQLEIAELRAGKR